MNSSNGKPVKNRLM